jgi:hypothetical protein
MVAALRRLGLSPSLALPYFNLVFRVDLDGGIDLDRGP